MASNSIFVYYIFLTVALPEIRGEKDSLPFHMLSMAALFNYYGTP